jgi:flagellar hook-basal body complex protein FliE
MTDINDVLAARNAIIQQNAALRAAPQGVTNSTASRDDMFAASFTEARAAVLQAAPTAQPGVPATSTASQPEGFGATLSNMVSRVNGNLEQEDAATEAYERGETTDITTVALMQQRASVSFEATLQIRNKLLSAYKDVMNMPV